MTSLERVTAALKGGDPDRVPVAMGFSPVPARVFPEGLRVQDVVDALFVSPDPFPALERFRRYALPFQPDTRLGTPMQARNYARWRYRPERGRGQNPLARARSLRDFERMRFPGEELSERVRSAVAAEVSDIHRRGMAAGGTLPHLGGELFESAWRLRGLEAFLYDMHERPAWAHALLDRLEAFAAGNARALAAAGIDVLSLGDDVGMPGSMMIGPAPWREFFKPRLARIISGARSVSPRLCVLYHSDGWFEPIIPDLLEIGVDAINPLQPEHMDAAAIRRTYGAAPALWGTVGSQNAFARARPEDIKREVRLRVKELGPRGLVLSPAYDIDTPEISKDNVAAFLSAARE
jgi:uroporphyrinogen decarboxylase